MSNNLIRAELETRLYTWANAQSPKIPIAFEGVAYTKPSDGVFLEAILIPNITNDVDVAATRQRLMGIFQVNCWAKSGKGMGEVERLANSIIDLYPILPKTGNVSIESTPYAGSPIHDTSGWVVIPVTIPYRYEQTS